MVRVADYVMNKLLQAGVRDVFTVTGRGILFLTDALAKNSLLRHISVHNEQAGAYSAMAYAQLNGTIGACLVSTGCGSTNAITGVLCAYQDSVPCIFISGQNMLDESTAHTHAMIRTYGSQEADIVSIVSTITKYATTITEAGKVAEELEKALFLMNSGRPGPVWIDIPLNIQNERIEEEDLTHFCKEAFLSECYDGMQQAHVEQILAKEADVELDKIRILLNRIETSERPLILAGGGIRQSGCVEEFRHFVEEVNIPVVYSPAAADTYGKHNRLSIGSVGSLGGTREGNFALQNADFVLCLGCGLKSVLTGNLIDKFAREAFIAVVNIDENQINSTKVRKDLVVNSDIKKVISLLLEHGNFSETNYDIWIDKCLHWKKIFPLGREKTDVLDLYSFSQILSDKITEDTTIICDAGYEELIVPSIISCGDANRCIHPAAQGAMGFAIPASVGVSVQSKSPVVVVVGDGSIMMNLQELQTIKSYELPVKIFVICNNMYSVIRKRQNDLFRSRTIGTEPNNGVSCPEFSQVANCFGIKYEYIDAKNVNAKLDNVLGYEGSVLCEVECTSDQRYLHMSVGKNQSGRVVHKPLEDLSPFLDRDIMKSEMIIECVDL